jgi:hypothetical protein
MYKKKRVLKVDIAGKEKDNTNFHKIFFIYFFILKMYLSLPNIFNFIVSLVKYV